MSNGATRNKNKYLEKISDLIIWILSNYESCLSDKVRKVYATERSTTSKFTFEKVSKFKGNRTPRYVQQSVTHLKSVEFLKVSGFI